MASRTPAKAILVKVILAKATLAKATLVKEIRVKGIRVIRVRAILGNRSPVRSDRTRVARAAPIRSVIAKV